MNRAIYTVAICLFITVLSPSVFAQGAKLSVVATFTIIGDFARQVGGDHINLKILVGPNGDSHVYEPKPADARALARADVVLTNGMLFEGFLKRLIDASGTTATIAVLTDGAKIVQDPLGGHYDFIKGEAVFHAAPNDPHVWQSVANAKKYVENIVIAFCAADGANCPHYKANAAAYLDELTALDVEVRDAVNAIPEERRVVVVVHNAFRYFEEAYGMHFLAPVGVSTESEASAADVAGLIREVRERNATAVFGENTSNSRLVEQIASEAGLELAGILFSDALSGPDGPASTYVEMMRANIKTITAAIAAQ